MHTVVGATSKLDFISFIGTVGNEVLIPSEAKSVLYSELSSLYSLKIAVVLKQRGMFVFYIPNMVCNGIRGKNCTNASFDMNVTNTEKHFNLFQYALGFPADALHLKNGYCFRVQ